ncbi:MAG: hypothetical protein ACM3S4_11650 [Burkholderiales bacterium]
MKIKRARKPKNPTAADRLHLPGIYDNVTLENLNTKNDSHKVSLGPDSKR